MERSVDAHHWAIRYLMAIMVITIMLTLSYVTLLSRNPVGTPL
jgi:hypothetical protein